MDKETAKIFELFESSLEDSLLSRKESRDLNTLFDTVNPSRHEKHILRSKLFDRAKQEIVNGNSEIVLDWLEKSVKLLIEDRNTESSSVQNEICFSPGTSCQSAIIRLLRSAKREIKICVFTISDDTISNEIIAAHKRGVSVQIISDDDKQYDRGSDIEKLSNRGISVRVDKTSNHMHNKFMTVDNSSSLTGSYNWTRSAAKYNQENIVVSNDLHVVKAFNGEFSRLWKLFK